MVNKKYTISIIREARIDENRTPITPNQVQELIKKFPNLHILVQTSKKRCFRDKDYLNAGAEITEDISNADIIFGVKEVDISTLIENKTIYFFHIQLKFEITSTRLHKTKLLFIRKSF